MKDTGPVDFVIITALEDERDAVLSFLPTAQKQSPTEEDVRVYFYGDVSTRFPDGSNGSYRVVLTCQLAMGRVEAANCANDAIRRWQPRFVLLVGIAGGIAEAGVALGDVIVSDQVIDYELQKITEAGPDVRYSVHRADPRMLGAVLNLNLQHWLERVAEQRPEPGTPKRLVGPIATGDKVVAVKALMQRYRRDWPKLIGVEMEAGGVASAAFQSASRPGFLMIRGVSDLADKRKEASQTKPWRTYAYRLAASYAMALIENGPIPSPTPGLEVSSISSGLDLAVDERLEINEEKLIRQAYASLRNADFPSELSVRFHVPQYQALVQRIHQQASSATDLSIVADQLSALAAAEKRMSAGEIWCAKLLIEIQKCFGIPAALKACKRYVRLFLTYTLHELAKFQIGDQAICEDLIRSMHNLDDFLPGIIWLAYQTTPLLKIEIALSPESRDTSLAFVPLNRVENHGGGDLIGGLWDSTEYLPVDVWCEYVVPQLTVGSAIGFQSYYPWARKSSHYITLGHVYVEGVEYEYKHQRYGTSNFFEVAPLLRNAGAKNG